MTNVTSFLLSYVLIYKYVAIFVITFLGAIALPLPSGTVVMASAAFATQGYLNFFAVLFFSILGNMAGDNSGYWIARKYGLPVFYKLGLRKIVDSEKRHKLNRGIDKHPLLIIYFSRFMTGIAPTVNVVCGLASFSYKKYLTFEALGELTECAFFCLMGYVFGTNWQSLTQFSGSSWIFIFSGALLTYLVWKFIFRKNKKV